MRRLIVLTVALLALAACSDTEKLQAGTPLSDDQGRSAVVEYTGSCEQARTFLEMMDDDDEFRPAVEKRLESC